MPFLFYGVPLGHHLGRGENFHFAFKGKGLFSQAKGSPVGRDKAQSFKISPCCIDYWDIPGRRARQKQCCIALRGNGGIGCRKFGRLVVGGLLHCLLAWSHRLCSVPGYGLRRIPSGLWRRYVSGCRLYGAVAYVRRVRPRGVDPCIVGKQSLVRKKFRKSLPVRPTSAIIGEPSPAVSRLTGTVPPWMPM